MASSWMRLVPLQMRCQRDTSALPPCEDIAKIQSSVNQKYTKSADTRILDFQPPGLWEINFGCLHVTQSMKFCYGSPNRKLETWKICEICKAHCFDAKYIRQHWGFVYRKDMNHMVEDLCQHTIPPRTAAASAPGTVAGQCRPTALPATPKHSQEKMSAHPSTWPCVTQWSYEPCRIQGHPKQMDHSG